MLEAYDHRRVVAELSRDFERDSGSDGSQEKFNQGAADAAAAFLRGEATPYLRGAIEFSLELADRIGVEAAALLLETPPPPGS